MASWTLPAAAGLGAATACSDPVSMASTMTFTLLLLVLPRVPGTSAAVSTVCWFEPAYGVLKTVGDVVAAPPGAERWGLVDGEWASSCCWLSMWGVGCCAAGVPDGGRFSLHACC